MTTSILSRPATDARWINASIAIGSAMFIIALAVSAYFEPQWRVLHFFQALIYLAVVLLARRNSAWGFGAGVVVASFWNFLVLVRTPVGSEIVKGHLLQPDILIQGLGALGHFLIIFACLVGFLRTRPGGRQFGEFAMGGVLAVGYLLLMAFTIGPPEAAQHIRQALGI